MVDRCQSNFPHYSFVHGISLYHRININISIGISSWLQSWILMIRADCNFYSSVVSSTFTHRGRLLSTLFSFIPHYSSGNWIGSVRETHYMTRKSNISLVFKQLIKGTNYQPCMYCTLYII